MKTLPFLLALSLTVGMPAVQANAQAEPPGAHFLEQWDLDADGQVTLAEAREKRSEVFVMFDADEDGSLNDPEWQAIAEHLATEEAGGSGGQGAGKGGMQGGRGPGAYIHAAMTPAFNDADGNGVVTSAEFTAATDTLFPQIDRNNDGVLTAADFGRN